MIPTPENPMNNESDPSGDLTLFALRQARAALEVATTPLTRDRQEVLNAMNLLDRAILLEAKRPSVAEIEAAAVARCAKVCRTLGEAASQRIQDAAKWNPAAPDYYASHQDGIRGALFESADAIEKLLPETRIPSADGDPMNQLTRMTLLNAAYALENPETVPREKRESIATRLARAAAGWLTTLRPESKPKPGVPR